MNLQCTHCNVTYVNQPSVQHATNQHMWTSDHAPEWIEVG